MRKLQDDTDFQEALGLGQDQEDDYVDGAADGEEAAGIDVDGDQDMGRQVNYDTYCKKLSTDQMLELNKRIP
jgi:hypothetical protein